MSEVIFMSLVEIMDFLGSAVCVGKISLLSDGAKWGFFGDECSDNSKSGIVLYKYTIQRKNRVDSNPKKKTKLFASAE